MTSDTADITFAVSGVDGPLPYAPELNTNPDADDSDGTSITVSRI